MYDHLLIPVDGSEEAKRAAKYGIKLAQAFDATVVVLHVLEQKALRLTESDVEKEQLRERGETILNGIEDLASDIGYPITTKIVEGKPASRISEIASEQDSSLIVLGRQGTTGLGKRLLGGVTEQVLHRSDTPVFVVPKSDHTKAPGIDFTRLLLPTDGSENAEVAVRFGTPIAHHYGSTVHVLNVVDLQAAGGVFNAGGLEKQLINRLEADGEEAVERMKTKITETTPDLTVKTTVQRTSDFEGCAAGIREYVERNDIGLIVMGSHGRSNLGSQFLGSVTATLLRTVDIPVLVVKRAPRV